MPSSERAKKVVGAIYSAAAKRLYEPIVVHGAFRLFGGNLNDLALEQGRRAVGSANGGPILDMPVGTAFFTVPLARAHDGLVVGADIAEGMVERAAQAGRDAGVPNLAVVRADAHRLPFADGSFAAVLCTNGLQVIPGLRPAVVELARILAPGARLFVSILTLPAARVLPPRSRAKLPTMLWSGAAVAAVIEATGLRVDPLRKERLATLIEAHKPG